jgi:hypothetical protein
VNVSEQDSQPDSSPAGSGGPGSAGGRLREIAARLAAIATELEGEGADDERAVELAHEAAELSAEAVEEATRRIRGAESPSE